jgi:hypothetical protein
MKSRGKIVQRQKNFLLNGQCPPGNIVRHKKIEAGKREKSSDTNRDVLYGLNDNWGS